MSSKVSCSIRSASWLLGFAPTALRNCFAPCGHANVVIGLEECVSKIWKNHWKQSSVVMMSSSFMNAMMSHTMSIDSLNGLIDFDALSMHTTSLKELASSSGVADSTWSIVFTMHNFFGAGSSSSIWDA